MCVNRFATQFGNIFHFVTCNTFARISIHITIRSLKYKVGPKTCPMTFVIFALSTHAQNTISPIAHTLSPTVPNSAQRTHTQSPRQYNMQQHDEWHHHNHIYIYIYVY